MFFTYILLSSSNNSYYVGSCGDMDNRLSQHNQGLVKSTKRYRPWVVIHIEEYQTLAQARKREKKIKSWKKREAMARMIENSKFNKIEDPR